MDSQQRSNFFVNSSEMTLAFDDRNDVAIGDRDEFDLYCKSYRTLRYSFVDSLNDLSERFLGPVDLFCDRKIKAEIDCAFQKPRFLESIPPARVPEQVKSISPVIITTSKSELTEVLGKVVEVVVSASLRGSRYYDYSALNSLFVQDSAREHWEDEEITLTYQELQKVVTQVVISSKESVKEHIGIPGGIVISNLKHRRSMIDLNWAC